MTPTRRLAVVGTPSGVPTTAALAGGPFTAATPAVAAQ